MRDEVVRMTVMIWFFFVFNKKKIKFAAVKIFYLLSLFIFISLFLNVIIIVVALGFWCVTVIV